MRFLLLCFALAVVTYRGFSQDAKSPVSAEIVSDEVYFKVKTFVKPPDGTLKSGVALLAEVPFLDKYDKLFEASTLTRPFAGSKSVILQTVYRVKVKSSTQINTFIELLKNEVRIEYAEKVPVSRAIYTPDDGSLPTQWHLKTIKAQQAWGVSTGIANVVVAVVDNAIQANHPDLAANMVAGRDVANNDADPNPPLATFSHGTHVAGIAGATTNNGTGIASAGFNKVKIMPVKATRDSDDPNSITYGYESVAWAAQNGAKIISMSWGGSGASITAQNVINDAAAMGILLIAAAGNDNTENKGYPAAYDNVLSVASTAPDDAKSSFSTYGTWVDIAAPGSGIYSTLPFDTYGIFSGTSMATPLVASVCGYIWSNNPTWTAAQVETHLKATADNIDPQNAGFVGKMGAGRINMFRAVGGCAVGGQALSISSDGSRLICAGGAVNLTPVPAGSYVWKRNGELVQGASSAFTATQRGGYSILTQSLGCFQVSESFNVLDKLSTQPPLTTNRVLCQTTPLVAGNGLQSSAPNCLITTTNSYAYTGGTIGYDNNNRSGASDPTVAVTQVGKVSKVVVSVTWIKKTGGTEADCGTANLGGDPYYREVSFRIKAPSGRTLTLVPNSLYRGATNSGTVTTVFEDSAAGIVAGFPPVSGVFSSAEALAGFNNENSAGSWTLLPNDNGGFDPLCVSGFSLTVSSLAPGSAAPIFTWYADSTSSTVLHTGTEFLPSVSSAGLYKYYAQANCQGACNSPRTAVYLSIDSPNIRAYPVSFSVSNNELVDAKNLQLQATAGGYTLVGSGSNGNTVRSSITLGAPLAEPVTICPNQLVMILANCCQGTLSWANGATGAAIIVSPSATTTYQGDCSPAAGVAATNLQMTVYVNPALLTISSSIPASTNQTFNAQKIEASNVVKTVGNVVYKASSSVLLGPGFAVSGSQFKAVIGGCN